MHSDRPGDVGIAARAVELLDRGVYLDASAWNALAKHPNRDVLVAAARQRQVVGSVVSAGEILKTRRSVELRGKLSAVMRSVLGERPLLEHPLRLVKASAESFARGDGDMLLQPTGPVRTLMGYLSQPEAAEVPTLEAWLGNLEDNLERFRGRVEPDEPSRTHFLAPDILGSDAFLELLLKLPPAVELGLTLRQVRDLCDRTDLWRALAGTLASVVTQVLSRSPKKRNGLKRPGAADLWQAIYLGVVEVFVTGDERQLEEVVREVSAVLRYPRCVVYASEFLAALDPAQVLSGPACPVCRCALPPSAGPAVRAGFHARVA